MDLKEANTIAHNMINKLGLGVNLISSDKYSHITQADIDKEVIALLSYSYQEAKRIITENKEIIDELVEKLLKYETLLDTEFY
jgi:cell division protease FtsH